MEQENELGVKPIKKLLWKLAIPAITAQIVNVLYNVVDRIYIGHIPEAGADRCRRLYAADYADFRLCHAGRDGRRTAGIDYAWEK